jgi:hypothetical protein
MRSEALLKPAKRSAGIVTWGAAARRSSVGRDLALAAALALTALAVLAIHF